MRRRSIALLAAALVGCSDPKLPPPGVPPSEGVVLGQAMFVLGSVYRLDPSDCYFVTGVSLDERDAIQQVIQDYHSQSAREGSIDFQRATFTFVSEAHGVYREYTTDLDDTYVLNVRGPDCTCSLDATVDLLHQAGLHCET